MLQGALVVFIVYFGFQFVVACMDQNSERRARNNGIVFVALLVLYVLAGGGS